jgi:hypothetical protein
MSAGGRASSARVEATPAATWLVASAAGWAIAAVCCTAGAASRVVAAAESATVFTVACTVLVAPVAVCCTAVVTLAALGVPVSLGRRPAWAGAAIAAHSTVNAPASMADLTIVWEVCPQMGDNELGAQVRLTLASLTPCGYTAAPCAAYDFC